MDSHVTVADKDCRTCHTRRIKCDRRLPPPCGKCLKKRLTCPGYTRPLRWANSVAVRGRYRGLDAPVIHEAEAVTTAGGLLPTDVTSPLTDGPSSQGLTVTSIIELIGEQSVCQLLQHYATTITPIIVWIDSEENGYRRLIVPLADSQPILKLAIVVTSAAHLSSGTTVDQNVIDLACQVAIASITEKVKHLTERGEGRNPQLEINVADIEAVLAAVLVLSNYSLIKSNLSLAQFHRQAARVITKTLASIVTVDDTTYIFLKNQLAEYDVLACTTLFELENIRNVVLPGSKFSIFGHFLRIVHAITIWPEQLEVYDNIPMTSIKHLENHLEVAQGATLLAAGRLLEHRNDSVKHDFIQLAAAYHHAAVLYAYQRLPCFDFDEHARNHVDALFMNLGHFKETNIFLANIAWPLFIAGICSRNVGDRQEEVLRFYELLSKDTRYNYYHSVADFLHEVWQSDGSDWIAIARRREQKSQPVIPV